MLLFTVADYKYHKLFNSILLYIIGIGGVMKVNANDISGIIVEHLTFSLFITFFLLIMHLLSLKV